MVILFINAHKTVEDAMRGGSVLHLVRGRCSSPGWNDSGVGGSKWVTVYTVVYEASLEPTNFLHL